MFECENVDKNGGLLGIERSQSGKIRVIHKVIHIIHIKTYVFGGLLYNKKRTDVLVSYDKNANMSKKLG